MDSIFLQIGLLASVAAIFGYLLKYLKLPMLPGYIFAGVLLGPVFNFVDPNSELIKTMAEIGLLLITFEIGASMRLSFLRSYSLNIGIIAISELIVIIFLAYLTGVILNLPFIFIILLILFAVNTSTSIAFKLIEETGIRKEYSERESKLLLGVASFEDLIAIIGLGVFQIIFAAQGINFLDILSKVYYLILIFISLLGFGLLFFKKVLDLFYKYGEELALLAGFSFAFISSWVGQLVGLSPILGAFIGGLIFSESKVSEQFMERAKWVREIFAFMFFASIGLMFPSRINLEIVIIGITATLLIVFFKFFAFSFSIWINGITLERAISLALYMTAISEFAVIIVNQAITHSLLSSEFLVIAVSVMVFSSILASILTSKKEKIASSLLKLIPYNFRYSMETNIFRWIGSLSLTRSKLFMPIKEALGEILILIVIAFALSSISAYVFNVVFYSEISFKIYLLAIIVAFFSSSFLIIFIFLYNTFKKLFDIFIKDYRKSLSFNYISSFVISLSILLFILSLTLLQIYYFSFQFFYKSIDILGFRLFHISIIMLIIIFALIFYRPIYRLIFILMKMISGK